MCTEYRCTSTTDQQIQCHSRRTDPCSPSKRWFSQLLCDNFGNFLRRLAFVLASTFLYGYNPLTLPPPLDPFHPCHAKRRWITSSTFWDVKTFSGLILWPPGSGVGAAGPHFIRAYAKFQNVNHRLETLRAPGGGGGWVGWSPPSLRGKHKGKKGWGGVVLYSGATLSASWGVQLFITQGQLKRIDEVIEGRVDRTLDMDLFSLIFAKTIHFCTKIYHSNVLFLWPTIWRN